MLKKSLVAVLFSLIMAMVLGTSAFAADGLAQDKESEMSPEIAAAIAEVNYTNEKIYAEIDKAIIKSNKMYDKYQEQLIKQQDSVKTAKLTEDYQKNSDKLISKLKVKTEKMTLKGIKKAEKAGLVVEIEFVPIKFADRTELIDPIVVVSW